MCGFNCIVGEVHDNFCLACLSDIFSIFWKEAIGRLKFLWMQDLEINKQTKKALKLYIKFWHLNSIAVPYSEKKPNLLPSYALNSFLSVKTATSLACDAAVLMMEVSCWSNFYKLGSLKLIKRGQETFIMSRVSSFICGL